MYEIVKPCPEKIRKLNKLKDLPPDMNPETVLLEELFSPREAQTLAQTQDLLSDDYSVQLENPQYRYQTPGCAEFICQNNNLLQLEYEIDCLKRSLIKYQLRHQDFREDKFKQGLDILQRQSEKINDLSAQLEAEILKFKTLAREVNQDYHAWQNYQIKSKDTSAQIYRTRPANIWEIRSSVIPTVVKQGNQFILTTKPVGEVAEDNPENRVKKATLRQKALESWLEAKRKRIMEDFSSP